MRGLASWKMTTLIGFRCKRSNAFSREVLISFEFAPFDSGKFRKGKALSRIGEFRQKADEAEQADLADYFIRVIRGIRVIRRLMLLHQTLTSN